MTDLKEAAMLSLEALNKLRDFPGAFDECLAATKALRLAIAMEPAPVQEPNEERSRVLFERHWRKTRGEKKSDRELTRHPLQPQTYVQDSANRHWITWQAALKSATPAAQPAPVQEPVAWMYWQSCLNDDGTQTAPWVQRYSKFKPPESVINKEITPLYTTPSAAQPASQCKGIPRKGCNYLATCDTICNKCGELHHHHQMVAGFLMPQQRKPLTFEQVEDCFPSHPPAGVVNGEVFVSAQWLHDFATNIQKATHGIKDKP